jgi:hypothetical protein
MGGLSGRPGSSEGRGARTGRGSPSLPRDTVGELFTFMTGCCICQVGANVVPRRPFFAAESLNLPPNPTCLTPRTKTRQREPRTYGNQERAEHEKPYVPQQLIGTGVDVVKAK